MWTLPSLLLTLSAWSLGLFLVGGLEALARRRDPASPRRSRAERHGLALLAGLGILAALETAATVALGPLPHSLVRVGIGLCLLSGLPFLRASFARTTVAPDEPPATRWHKLGFIAIGLFGVFAVFYAASSPMHLWDPIFHFAYKGKLIEHEGFGTPSWLVDPNLGTGATGVGRVITHPNYPPGIGAWHALVAQIGGTFEVDATRAIFSVFAIAPALLLWSKLRDRGRGAAILGSLSWLALPFLYYSRLPKTLYTFDHDESQFVRNLTLGEDTFPEIYTGLFKPFFSDPDLTVPDGWTLDGAGDLPLAAMVFAAVVQLLRFVPGQDRRGNLSDLTLGGLLLGSALLVKNEGLLLWLGAGGVLAAAVLVCGPKPALPRWRNLLPLGAALGLAIVVALPWLAIRGQIPSIDEDYPRALKIVLGLAEPPETMLRESNQPTNLAAAWKRVPVVSTLFVLSSLNVFRWSMTWLLFAAGSGWLLLGRTRYALRHAATPEILIVLVCCFGYGVTLILTPWNLLFLAGTVIPGRLMLHVAPLAIAAGVAIVYSRRDGIESPIETSSEV